jgi:transcriptional regulator with XRE-family HTH domain
VTTIGVTERKGVCRMTLLRRVLGETLRGQRLRQRRTLREVSGAARVSLGYLSEVERGQKEASSELLASICAALDVRLSEVLREVSDSMRRTERAADITRAPARQLVPAGAGRVAGPAGAAATPVELPVGRDGGELPVEFGLPAELDRAELVDRAELDRAELDRAELVDRVAPDTGGTRTQVLDGVDLADLETGDGLGDVDALLSLTDLSCCLDGPHHATTCLAGAVAAA